MNVKQDVLVLAGSSYDFYDDETKTQLKGCTIRYLFTEQLTPSEKNGIRGYKVAKASMPYEFYDTLKDVPAIYTGNFDVDIASDGKTKMTAIDFQYARPFGKVKAV